MNIKYSNFKETILKIIKNSFAKGIKNHLNI